MSIRRRARWGAAAGRGRAEAPDAAPANGVLAAPAGEARYGAVRVGTLLGIRWFAIIGQASALMIVSLGLGAPVPLSDCAAVVATSVLLNCYLLFTRRATTWLSDRESTLQLGYDVVQLAVLLHLTGGLANPFSLLILAPVTVSATILRPRSTIILSLLAGAAITTLTFAHRPLPWPGEPFAPPQMFLFGCWVALILAVSFIALYASRVSAEARRMAEALAATQMALAREHQVSAVGAMAAAAAHELGSPLGTILVIANELKHDIDPGSPLADDVNLLLSESRRCRDILARLGEQAEAPRHAPLDVVPLSVLVDDIAAKLGTEQVEIEIARASRDGATEPLVRRSPEIVHSFTNLLANAVGFATSRVRVDLGWSGRDVRALVIDDGPGFPPAILPRLGEPYVSIRAGEAGHMGLGVFIAKTLLARTGAEVDFANRPGGGAQVAIRWLRPIIEARED